MLKELGFHMYLCYESLGLCAYFRFGLWEISRHYKEHIKEWCSQSIWRIQIKQWWSQSRLQSIILTNWNVIFPCYNPTLQCINWNNLVINYIFILWLMSRIVQFSSRSAYDAALRAVAKKGRLYRMERVITN